MHSLIHTDIAPRSYKLEYSSIRLRHVLLHSVWGVHGSYSQAISRCFRMTAKVPSAEYSSHQNLQC